jgi:sporulation protein YlmC with PRC-barrel domain
MKARWIMVASLPFAMVLACTANATSTPQAGGHDIRMSRLIGMQVQDRQGHARGKVDDVIVDTTDGRVRYAVVDMGGFLGIGDHRTAVPLERIRGNIDHGHVVIDMSSRELRNFPNYPPDHDFDWNSLAFRNKVDGAVPAPAGVSTEGHSFRSGEKLLHADLRDGLYHDVGDVKDLVVDLDTGKVVYGVARFDPSWSANPRLVVLRPSQVRFDQHDDDLVMVATQQELRDAPTFVPGRLDLARKG